MLNNPVENDKKLMESTKKRIIVFIIVVSSIFFTLLLRMWELQVLRGSHFTNLSVNNRIREIRVKAPRGDILDRDGKIIVRNRPCYSLVVVPEDIRDEVITAGFLVHQLKIGKSVFFDIVKEVGRKSFEPVSLKREIAEREVAVVEEHRSEFPSLAVDVEPVRYYVYGKLAAHMLGYLGEVSGEQLKLREYQDCKAGDTVGQCGIECAYNDYLTGVDGYRFVETDAIGREIRTLKFAPPKAGSSLVLTLDIGLQEIVEHAMGDKPGAVIVLEPYTGDVLAMVSSPGFDPNVFSSGISMEKWDFLVTDPLDPLQNRAIHTHYPPGSVFKIVMSMAALETGVINLETKYFCKGYLPFGGRYYKCWKGGGHGWVNLHEALVHSCNVFFYHLGLEVGPKTIAHFARACGLGVSTGIDVPFECRGLIPDPTWKSDVLEENWYPGETLSYAIGQGFLSVTPLQLAQLIAAIANGGTIYKPHVLKKVISTDGKVISECVPEIVGSLPVSAKNLLIIKKALKDAVNDGGTGRGAKLPHIIVAGKTGTAQVASLSRADNIDLPKKLEDHGWFVAFAPYESPRIAICALLEHGGHGGSAAVPVVRDIINSYSCRRIMNGTDS